MKYSHVDILLEQVLPVRRCLENLGFRSQPESQWSRQLRKLTGHGALVPGRSGATSRVCKRPGLIGSSLCPTRLKSYNRDRSTDRPIDRPTDRCTHACMHHACMPDKSNAGPPTSRAAGKRDGTKDGMSPSGRPAGLQSLSSSNTTFHSCHDPSRQKFPLVVAIVFSHRCVCVCVCVCV